MTTTRAKATHARICPECGVAFKTTDPRVIYCTPAHKQARSNRDTVRGKALVVIAQAWRQGRSTKDPAKRRAAKVAFSEMCRMLDAYSAEDHAAGRVSQLDIVVARHKRQGIHQTD